MFDPRNNLAHQVADEVKRALPRVRLGHPAQRAPERGAVARQARLLYDVQSKGAQGYLSLARELLASHGTRDDGRDAGARADAMTIRSAARSVAGSTRCSPPRPVRRGVRRQERLSRAPSRRSSRRRGSRGSTSTPRRSTSSRSRSASTACSSRSSSGACRAGTSFEIIAGERRWRALPEGGLREALVVVKDVSAEDAFELALIENVQREDLNAVELAEALDRLVKEHGYTQESLATRLGKDRSTIATRCAS
jgi:hypothetical protein